MQRWGTAISGFGPSLLVVGPLFTVLYQCALVGYKITELTSLSSNQAFTIKSLTWILSHKTEQLQKFNARYAEMQLLAYRSVPCVFWKFEVRERLGLKLEVEELCSLASYGTLTTGTNTVHITYSCS